MHLDEFRDEFPKGGETVTPENTWHKYGFLIWIK
jgi:hypothetical protein